MEGIWRPFAIESDNNKVPKKTEEINNTQNISKEQKPVDLAVVRPPLKKRRIDTQMGVHNYKLPRPGTSTMCNPQLVPGANNINRNLDMASSMITNHQRLTTGESLRNSTPSSAPSSNLSYFHKIMSSLASSSGLCPQNIQVSTPSPDVNKLNTGRPCVNSVRPSQNVLMSTPSPNFDTLNTEGLRMNSVLPSTATSTEFASPFRIADPWLDQFVATYFKQLSPNQLLRTYIQFGPKFELSKYTFEVDPSLKVNFVLDRWNSANPVVRVSQRKYDAIFKDNPRKRRIFSVNGVLNLKSSSTDNMPLTGFNTPSNCQKARIAAALSEIQYFISCKELREKVHLLCRMKAFNKVLANILTDTDGSTINLLQVTSSRPLSSITFQEEKPFTLN